MKKYAYTAKRQIHYVPNITGRCHVGPNNSKPCRGFKAWFLLTFCGYDGCGHCWPKKSKINA
jgi:hypothetical protein